MTVPRYSRRLAAVVLAAVATIGLSAAPASAAAPADTAGVSGSFGAPTTIHATYVKGGEHFTLTCSTDGPRGSFTDYDNHIYLNWVSGGVCDGAAQWIRARSQLWFDFNGSDAAVSAGTEGFDTNTAFEYSQGDASGPYVDAFGKGPWYITGHTEIMMGGIITSADNGCSGVGTYVLVCDINTGDFTIP